MLLTNGNYAFNILEINANGDITKNKTVQPTNAISGQVLNGQYIASNQNNDAYYYAGDYQNATQSFSIVSKLDTTFTVLWSKKLDFTANYLEKRSMLATTDGGLLICLDSDFSGFVGSDYILRNNAFIVKLDQSGNVQWGRKIETSSQSISARRITPVETTNGYYIAFGSSLVTNNNGNADQILIKFDKTNGSTAWMKYFNGLTDMTLLSNGKILFTTEGDYQFVTIDESGAIAINKKAVNGKLYRSMGVLEIGTDNYYVRGFSTVASKRNLHLMSLDNTLSNCTTTTGNIVSQAITSGITNTAYTWTSSNFGITISNQTNIISQNLTGTTASECATSCTTAAAIAPLSINTFCANQDIALTSISTGATNFIWYKDSLNTTLAASGTTATLSFATSGIHKIYLVATNGDCSSNTSISLIINELPAFTVATTIEKCGSKNGTATVNMSSSNQGITVQWSNNATSQTASGLSAGNYSVTVTNPSGCIASQNVAITNTSTGFTLLDTTTQITCFGLANGSIKLGTVNAQAPVVYNWDPSVSSRIIENLAPNIFSVTVSDAAGCVQQKTFTISQPQKLYANLLSIDVTTCGSSNGFITANAIGGTPPITYLWNNGQTTQTALNLAQNNYFVTITDGKGCTTRNTGTVGTQSKRGEIFYSNPTLSGISNVVLHRGQFAMMVAKDPASKFAGYPDTLAQFIKMDLINESGTLYNLETSAAAAHPVHGNVTLTPDGKISMVYQAPTGTSYGFRGMHRIYDCGTTLSLDEQVFSNANSGAWMRHIEETNRTRVVSYAHGGYYILHHKKENGGAWSTVSFGDANNYLAELALAKKSDNSLWFSGRYGFSVGGPLRYYGSADGTSYTYGEFSNPVSAVSNNCDAQFTGTDQLALLFNQNDTLRLFVNVSGNSWTGENIIYQPNIAHRASIFYRPNGNPVVAYQTTDKVVVMEKINNTWAVKYVQNSLIQSEQLGGSRAPSLVIKGTDLWVVYADGNNIYKYNLDLPCDYVQLTAKVLLQGAFNTTTLTMNDNLRTANLIPTNEPYTGLGFINIGGGNEAIPLGVTSCLTSNDAIVDWVFLELRDGKAPTTKLATRCALLQKDGDIVDIDGISPVVFKNIAPNADYYVAVRHRNHLGVMTATPISLNRDKNSTKIDFTDPSVSAWGTNAQKNVSGKMCLWAGNVVQDGKIKYSGSSNDRAPILVRIGGNIITTTVNGYYSEDVNMDGIVKYSGANNDRAIILVNIGGANITTVVIEQL